MADRKIYLAQKVELDDYLPKGGGTMGGDISMNNNAITDVSKLGMKSAISPSVNVTDSSSDDTTSEPEKGNLIYDGAFNFDADVNLNTNKLCLSESAVLFASTTPETTTDTSVDFNGQSITSLRSIHFNVVSDKKPSEKIRITSNNYNQLHLNSSVTLPAGAKIVIGSNVYSSPYITTTDENSFTINNKQIHGVIAPSANTDVANKAYVDQKSSPVYNQGGVFLQALSDSIYMLTIVSTSDQTITVNPADSSTISMAGSTTISVPNLSNGLSVIGKSVPLDRPYAIGNELLSQSGINYFYMVYGSHISATNTLTLDAYVHKLRTENLESVTIKAGTILYQCVIS